MFGTLRKKHRRVQKTNIPTSFRNFLKSSEIFGSLRKSSEKIGNFRKVLKTTLQQFFNFLWNLRKSSEIFGRFRKSVARNVFEIFGNCRKSSEKTGKCRKVLKTIFRHFENFRKFSKIFGNDRKTSEILGNFSNVIGGLWKFFILFQSLTPVDWGSDSGILICNLHWYYSFCTWRCYSLSAPLSANQNRVIFSCMF